MRSASSSQSGLKREVENVTELDVDEVYTERLGVGRVDVGWATRCSDFLSSNRTFLSAKKELLAVTKNSGDEQYMYKPLVCRVYLRAHPKV